MIISPFIHSRTPSTSTTSTQRRSSLGLLPPNGKLPRQIEHVTHMGRCLGLRLVPLEPLHTRGFAPAVQRSDELFELFATGCEVFAINVIPDASLCPPALLLALLFFRPVLLGVLMRALRGLRRSPKAYAHICHPQRRVRSSGIAVSYLVLWALISGQKSRNMF